MGPVLLSLLATIALAVSSASAADGPRQSADEQTYPEVAFSGKSAIPPISPHASLVERVQSHLLKPPEEVGKRVMSAEKSKRLLQSIMTHKEGTSSSTFKGKSTETVNGSVDVASDLGTEWFTWGLGGADVVGFDLYEGVIVRIVLFYKNPASARGILEAEKPKDADRYCTWEKIPDGPCLKIIVTVKAEAVAANGDGSAPVIKPDILQAIRDATLIVGMTQEDARLSLGKADSVKDERDSKTATWIKPSGDVWTAVFVDGKITKANHHAK